MSLGYLLIALDRYKGEDDKMTTDTPQKTAVKDYAEILWLLIKAEIVFIIIRLATSIRFTGGIFGGLFQ